MTRPTDFLKEADRIMGDFKIRDYKEVEEHLREVALESAKNCVAGLREKGMPVPRILREYDAPGYTDDDYMDDDFYIPHELQGHTD